MCVRLTPIQAIADNVLDICRAQVFDASDQHQAQRMMNALALFSNKLSAAVMLVDGKLAGSAGLEAEFAKTCEAAR